MGQKPDVSKTFKPKHITNAYGVKMLGVRMREKETPNKTRVYEVSKNDDELIMFLNSKTLNMVVPIDNPTRRTKSTSTMKRSSKKRLVFLERNHMCVLIILLNL